MQVQERTLIGEVSVPIIREDGIIYYPISFIMEKVLLKKTNQADLQKEYSQYIKKLKVDYGRDTGGIQSVNCISEDGLKKVIGNSKIGRLKVNQKKAMNILLEYLHMDLISEDDRFLNVVSSEMLSKWKYNEYIMDCIKYVLDNEPDIVWQKCTKCGNYYPYHINFYDLNLHGSMDYPLNTVCRDCKGWDHNRSKIYIKGKNNKFNFIYNTYGLVVYNSYKCHDTIFIYNHWKLQNKKKLPSIIQNKEDKLTIIKYMFDKGCFRQYENMNAEAIREVCGFGLYPIKLEEMYKYVIGIDFDEYKNIVRDFSGAKLIVDTYINKHNIIIDNIFDFDYYKIIRECSLTGFLDRCCNNDILEFIMRYYDNKYPAYKFKGGFTKYWTNKENRIQALKYFIEEDMKIPIEKVPLYITLTALRNKGTSTMYNVCKKYYSSLFEWVNEVYPERFDPKDFDIHYVRNDFDSIEEAEVDDILKKKFKNKVIYNPNNTDRTIKIDGKVPDWFLFTNNKCYIVEYFGLDMERNTSHNSRIEDYKERTEDKIEKYEKLDGYGKVYIFKDDLKDGFKGLMEKLDLIV